MSKLIENSNEPQVLKIVHGNDFSLRVYCTQYNAETDSWDFYDLSSAKNLDFYLVSMQFKRIKLNYEMQSDGSLLVDVLSNYLTATSYGVEITWETSNRNRRTFTPLMLQIVKSTPEADTDLSEYENSVYDLNIKITSDIQMIRIGGHTTIPDEDIATKQYIDYYCYSKDYIDDNYYDKGDIDNLMTSYINETDLNDALEQFESEIASEFIDHEDLDVALSYYATTDDLNDYATKSYVDEAIAAIPETDLSDYVTYSYLDSKQLASEAYVNEKISEIPQTDLSNYTTYAYINSRGFMTESRLNDLGYLRQADISAMSYATTNYVDTKVASIDIPDVSNLVSQSSLETQLQPYAKTSDITSAGYATQQYVENVTADMATKSYVTQKISEIPGVDLTGYATESYVVEKINEIDTSNLVSYSALDRMSYVVHDELAGFATQAYVATKVDGLVSYAAINEMSYVQQSSLDATLESYVTTTTTQTIPVTKTFNFGSSSLTDIAGQEQRSITIGRSVTNQTITGQIIAPLVSTSDGTGGVNIQNEIVCYAAPNGTTLQMTQLGKFTTQGIYEGTQKLSDKYATFNYVDQAIHSATSGGVMLASNSPVNASYIWTGTNAQLRDIQVKDPNTLYLTTDDEAQQIDLTPYQTKIDAATYYTTYAYVESRTPAIVVCTQAEYNSYVSGGTVDASTIYMIKEQ